jgi:hypothetical protein
MVGKKLKDPRNTKNIAFETIRDAQKDIMGARNIILIAENFIF